jgi:hypothetical protein
MPHFLWESNRNVTNGLETGELYGRQDWIAPRRSACGKDS